MLKKVFVLMMCVTLLLPGRLFAQKSEGIQVLVNGRGWHPYNYLAVKNGVLSMGKGGWSFLLMIPT
jgi:hypothetical protein